MFLGREKLLAAHYAKLREPFSGVRFRRPKDAFLLVFSSQTPICEHANIREDFLRRFCCFSIEFHDHRVRSKLRPASALPYIKVSQTSANRTPTGKKTKLRKRAKYVNRVDRRNASALLKASVQVAGHTESACGKSFYEVRVSWVALTSRCPDVLSRGRRFRDNESSKKRSV